jgi:hypothetical protein
MAKKKSGVRQEVPEHLKNTEMVMVVNERGRARMVRRPVEPKK